MSTRSASFDLVLASASPRRRELLGLLVQDFAIDPADIDESIGHAEAPASYVARVAQQKAAAVAVRHPQKLILASDTAVIVDDRILGKPINKHQAVEMLGLLSGRWHQVLSAVTLRWPDSSTRSSISVTGVEFARLPEAWVHAYVRGGEPMDKAGAYAVQGEAAAWIRRIDGSYSGVVGLPIYETAELLREAGLLEPAGTVFRGQSEVPAISDQNSNPRTVPHER